MSLNFVTILCLISGSLLTTARPPPYIPTTTSRPIIPIDPSIKSIDGPLCKEREETFEILTIFTLINETFIHIRNLTEAKVEAAFYRIKVDNSNMTIPQTFTNRDDLLKEHLDKIFTLGDPIFGFVLPMWSRFCRSEDTTEHCNSLIGVHGYDETKFFVCFHGVDKWAPPNLTTHPFWYNPFELRNLFESMDRAKPEVVKNAQDYCRSELRMKTAQSNTPALSIFTWQNWTRNSFPDYNNITVSNKTDDINMVVTSLAKPNTNFEIKQYFFQTNVWFAFSFNNYYKFMFCGKNCSLSNPLTWMILNKEEGILKEMRSVNFLTLRKLLGCDESLKDLDIITERPKDGVDPNSNIHNISNEGPLCTDKGRDFQIISVFSLTDETFIHSKDGNGKIEIWRIWGAYHILPENDIEIPFTVTENHYSDERMKQFLSEKDFLAFDLEKQIIPYVLPIYDILQTECSQLQPDAGNPYSVTNQSCNILNDYFNENTYFVCIIGANWEGNYSKKLVVTYDKTSVQFKTINDPGLYQKANHYCLNDDFLNNIEVTSSGLSSFSNWESKTNPYVWNNISVIKTENKDQDKDNMIIRTTMNINDKDYNLEESSFNENELWFVFRINTYYKHLFCGKPCTLDTTLFWKGYIKENNVPFKSNNSYPNARLTIKKLLGCKKTSQKAIPFEPNIFCETNKTFLSAFNLGEDLYFQRGGRFWRYRPPKGKHYNLFTNEANPDIKTKIGSIRYDSGVTELISNTFDTTRPIVGFTFIMFEIDLCQPYIGVSVTCIKKYFESEQHLRTCIYGYTEDITKPDKLKFNTSAYMYSPSGLRPFRAYKNGTKFSMEKETNNFCEYIYSQLGNIDKDLAVPEQPFILTSAVNPGYFYDKGKQYNQVFLVLTHKTSPSHNRLFHIKWSQENTLLIDMVDEEFTATEVAKDEFYFTILFTIGTVLWGFYGNLKQTLTEINHSYDRNQRGQIDHIITYNEIPKTLFDLIDCPVNTTTSLVTLFHRETPCQYNRSTDTESIFMIGGTLYHQVGQYFYTYDKQKRTFLYDKYVSELFNEYFDTTYRVTGYSVKDAVRQGIHKVIIHGRSHYQFRDYENILFAAFHINSSDPFSKLSAVNNPNDFNPGINWTLGVYNWHKEYKLGIQYSAIHRRLNTSDNKKYIPLLTFIVEVRSPLKIGPQPNTQEIDSAQFNLYMTNDPTQEMFVFNGLNLHQWQAIKATDIKGQVLGIAEFDNGFQTMVFNRKTTRNLFYLGKNTENIWLHLTFDYRAQYCSNVSEFKCQTKENGESYNCQIQIIEPQYPKVVEYPESPHKSESSSKKTLSKILVVVLLVLLITALIVGFILMYNKQKYFKEPNNPREDTSQPNQTNNTVVRHSQPKPLESDFNNESELSLEKTVRSDEI